MEDWKSEVRENRQKIDELESGISQNRTSIEVINNNLDNFKCTIEKIDGHQDKILEVIMDLTSQIPATIDASNVRLLKEIDEKLKTCRVIQRSYNNETYFKIPPGFIGNLVKLVVVLIASYGGYASVLKFFQ